MNKKLFVAIFLFEVFLPTSYASDTPEVVNPSGFWDHVWLQGSANFGYQQLSINSVAETPKNGTSIGGRLLGEYRDEHLGAFGLGIGVRQTSQEGSSAIRTQVFVDSALTVDFSYLTPVLGKFLWVGGLVDTSIANGAQFNFGNSDTLQGLVSAGPHVRFQYNARSIDWVAGAELLYALNAPSRTIWQLPIYVGLSIPFNAPGPAPVACVATPTERVPASVAVKLDAKVVQFEVNKTTLTPKSQRFLTEFAHLLMLQRDNWNAIVISGHTDASGNASKNRDLSNGRAKSVRNWLIQEGVPAETLTAEGHGSDILLPGLPLNAPEHRRVELSFEGVADGTKLQNSISDLTKTPSMTEQGGASNDQK